MSPLSGPLPVRGFLLHITHYDPVWCARKATERPFDLKVALAVIDAMAEAGLNLLIVDAKDAVAYATHPELARPYTQPMQILHRLREHAFARGIETAVKLNFSQSALHQHNHWFRPYHDLFDNAEYWQRGFQVIDELVAAVRPKRFFHIGMDEDHARSYTQYAAAIQTLHGGWRPEACAPSSGMTRPAPGQRLTSTRKNRCTPRSASRATSSRWCGTTRARTGRCWSAYGAADSRCGVRRARTSRWWSPCATPSSPAAAADSC